MILRPMTAIATDYHTPNELADEKFRSESNGLTFAIQTNCCRSQPSEFISPVNSDIGKTNFSSKKKLESCETMKTM